MAVRQNPSEPEPWITKQQERKKTKKRVLSFPVVIRTCLRACVPACLPACLPAAHARSIQIAHACCDTPVSCKLLALERARHQNNHTQLVSPDAINTVRVTRVTTRTLWRPSGAVFLRTTEESENNATQSDSSMVHMERSRRDFSPRDPAIWRLRSHA